MTKLSYLNVQNYSSVNKIFISKMIQIYESFEK
jgi:hypothetical protein